MADGETVSASTATFTSIENQRTSVDLGCFFGHYSVLKWTNKHVPTSQIGNSKPEVNRTRVIASLHPDNFLSVGSMDSV